MKPRKLAVMAVAIVLLAVTIGCGDFFVSNGTVTSVTLTPKNAMLTVGDTKQFTATGNTAGGSTTDVTSTATWTSSASATATVDSKGLVTAVAGGTATISAKADSNTGSATVLVTSSALQSIAVTPNNPNISTGATQQLKATGTFADNSTRDITNFVTWSTSNGSAASVSTGGLVTGVASGTATITASAVTSTATVSGTTTVTVQ